MKKPQAPSVEQVPGASCELPYCVTLGDLAPLFTADAFVQGTVKKVSLDEQRGKWMVLFFYSSDFTFV